MTTSHSITPRRINRRLLITTSTATICWLWNLNMKVLRRDAKWRLRQTSCRLKVGPTLEWRDTRLRGRRMCYCLWMGEEWYSNHSRKPRTTQRQRTAWYLQSRTNITKVESSWLTSLLDLKTKRQPYNYFPKASSLTHNSGTLSSKWERDSSLVITMQVFTAREASRFWDLSRRLGLKLRSYQVRVVEWHQT